MVTKLFLKTTVKNEVINSPSKTQQIKENRWPNQGKIIEEKRRKEDLTFQNELEQKIIAISSDYVVIFWSILNTHEYISLQKKRKLTRCS